MGNFPAIIPQYGREIANSEKIKLLFFFFFKSCQPREVESEGFLFFWELLKIPLIYTKSNKLARISTNFALADLDVKKFRTCLESWFEVILGHSP